MSEEYKALVTRFLDLTIVILMKEKPISKFCFTIKTQESVSLFSCETGSYFYLRKVCKFEQRGYNNNSNLFASIKSESFSDLSSLLSSGSKLK
ncbi:hypothetical protein [Chryseobacterium taeanense]|uniref:hypothetical protein n=1 Tax=Chryseobacterium taeanense TaxID=311334 RepID=UPI0035AEAD32